MKPMLAVGAAVSEIRFPVLASPKIDGIRATVIDGKLCSRSGIPIANKYIQHKFSRPELDGYDGELVSGSPTAPDSFRTTISACGSIDGMPEITFYAFDNFKIAGGFASRQASLLARIGVVVLEQKLIQSALEIRSFETEVLAAGYEGIIVRNPDSKYKFGRSIKAEQGMIKIKRFSDSEAKILGVVEEKTITGTYENDIGQMCKVRTGTGRAGTLYVRDITTGKRFFIGCGMSNADKKLFWNCRDTIPGAIIKYKSSEIGDFATPRFPVFLGVREAWDLS